MEKEKTVTIEDFGNKTVFKIHLFGITEGLAFTNKIADLFLKKDNSLSITAFLSDLLPLASLMDMSGEKVIKEHMSISDCEDVFQNPLSVIELGTEILELQKVFLQDSKIFRSLADRPELGSLTAILGSKTSLAE